MAGRMSMCGKCGFNVHRASAASTFTRKEGASDATRERRSIGSAVCCKPRPARARYGSRVTARDACVTSAHESLPHGCWMLRLR